MLFRKKSSALFNLFLLDTFALNKTLANVNTSINKTVSILFARPGWSSKLTPMLIVKIVTTEVSIENVDELRTSIMSSGKIIITISTNIRNFKQPLLEPFCNTSETTHATSIYYLLSLLFIC